MKNAAVAALYSGLLRQARRFPQYNFRAYALRRIKDEFKDIAQRSLAGAAPDVPAVLAAGRVELARLKRMTTVALVHATASSRLIIEDTTAGDKPAASP